MTHTMETAREDLAEKVCWLCGALGLVTDDFEFTAAHEAGAVTVTAASMFGTEAITFPATAKLDGRFLEAIASTFRAECAARIKQEAA